MRQTVDKLAIMNLAAGSDVIEAVKIMEETPEVHTIKIIRSDPTTIIRLHYVENTPDKGVNCSETPFIDCKLIASALLEDATTVLVEYSIGGIVEL